MYISRFHRQPYTRNFKCLLITQKLNNFHVPILVTSTSHKITALSRITAFNEETTLSHTFLSSDSRCLSPGDPRILCAKHRYLITGKSFISVSSTFTGSKLAQIPVFENFFLKFVFTSWTLHAVFTSVIPLLN